jgi:hypothetical protein
MLRCLLLIALTVSGCCVVGCGKPDPRKRPDFIDSTDPRAGIEELKKSLPKSTQKPNKSPGAKK